MVEIDMEALLAPLPGEDPCGVSLRYEGTYDRIREGRREDDPNLPQGIWQVDLKQAQWALVIRHATEALTKRSKDLQVAVWLVEALTRVDGFAGGRRGFEFLLLLCQTYWKGLYPRADDPEDLEARTLILEWVADKAVMAVKYHPITQPATSLSQPFSFLDYHHIQKIEQQAANDKKNQRGQRAKPNPDAEIYTKEKFETSADFTPLAYFRAVLDDIEAWQAAMLALDSYLDSVCGQDAPSFRALLNELNSIKTLVRDLYAARDQTPVEPELPVVVIAPPQDDSAEPLSPRVDRPSVAVGSFVLRNRDDAYVLLAQVADFLVQSDPHSPAPYLIRRAISFQNLTFTDLLSHLVDDDRQRVHLFKLLGVLKEGEEAKT
jgi:type VI secretion system protein ImpA